MSAQHLARDLVRPSSGLNNSLKRRSVLPVADSFSNKETRTFSRIRAHQSTRETINTS